MAQVFQVTLDNLGEGFLIDQAAGEIKVNLDVTTTQIYSEKIAGGDNGVNGSEIWERNSTVTRLQEGYYRVAFDNPHPDGIEYHVSFSGSEPLNTRDNPKVTLIYDTKSATGFDVMITVDDNGTGADPLEDNGWSFSVEVPVDVVSSVSASGFAVAP